MKRIQMVKVGNTKKLCLTQLIILTKTMSDKFNCGNLLQKIDNAAKDLHVEWAVELKGNTEFLAVSRVSDEDVITDDVLHKLEEDAVQFYNVVTKMELPEPECPSHDAIDTWDEKVDEEELEFVRSLSKDRDKLIGAACPHIGQSKIDLILDNVATIGHDTLVRMIDAYLKVYDHGKD